MKRPTPLPWQAEKARTAKARRSLPGCKTPGCKGKAMGLAWGSELCPMCRAAEKARETPLQPLNDEPPHPLARDMPDRQLAQTPAHLRNQDPGAQFVEQAMGLRQAEIEAREPQRSLVLNQDTQRADAPRET